MVDAAEVSGISLVYLPLKKLKPRGSVRIRSSRSIILESIKSFQVHMKINITTETMAGLIIGAMTFHNIVISFAPSILADSTRDLGTSLINPFKRKTENV